MRPDLVVVVGCPSSRHLNVALHHFRSEVALKKLIIVPIDSENQEADYLTKAPVEAQFLHNRKLTQGW